MKFFTLLGGFTGFSLALAAGLHAGNAPAFALRDAGIGCLVGALLLRGLHAVMMRSIRSHLAERIAAAAATRESAAMAPSSDSSK